MSQFWAAIDARSRHSRRPWGVTMLEYVFLLCTMTVMASFVLRTYWRPMIPKILTRFNAAITNFPNGG